MTGPLRSLIEELRRQFFPVAHQPFDQFVVAVELGSIIEISDTELDDANFDLFIKLRKGWACAPQLIDLCYEVEFSGK